MRRFFLTIITLLASLSSWSQKNPPPLPGYPVSPLGQHFLENFQREGVVPEGLFEIKNQEEFWTSYLSKDKTIVGEGVLRLETDSSDKFNGLLKVGGLRSHAYYSYGSLIVRAKANRAPGTISAIYFYNEDKDRQVGGRHEEIDIELSSKFPCLASLVTFHEDNWKSSDEGIQNRMHHGGVKNICNITGLRNFNSHQFNLYQIDWQPSKVVWTINGIKVWESTQAVPTTPMQIYLDTYNNNEWDAFIDPDPLGKGAFEIDFIKYDTSANTSKNN